MTQNVPSASAYQTRIIEVLDQVREFEAERIRHAARLCADVIAQDGMIYIFGTGHSHMMAEEGHFRAGGLANICPILSSSLMLHEGAAASTSLERKSTIAKTILGRYSIGQGDVLFLFSNSGVNAVPVEAAMEAKAAGAHVITALSRAYAESRNQTHPHTTADIADVVIDNHLPPGDAIVPVTDTLATGPGSTVVGAFILNAVLTEAIGISASTSPPIYISANMPGAHEHNAKLVERYRPRNPHL